MSDHTFAFNPMLASSAGLGGRARRSCTTPRSSTSGVVANGVVPVYTCEQSAQGPHSQRGHALTSYMVMAKLYTSDALVIVPPIMVSGLIHRAVPNKGVLCGVWSSSRVAVTLTSERPKSAKQAHPWSSTSMLVCAHEAISYYRHHNKNLLPTPLRSPWTICRWWRYTSPSDASCSYAKRYFSIFDACGGRSQ